MSKNQKPRQDEFVENLQKELFEREKNEWRKYFNEAREFSGADAEREYKLTFERNSFTIVGTRLGRKRTNVIPEICHVETSPDLKLVFCLHEFGHVRQYKKSEYHFGRLYSLWPSYLEENAFRFAYEKLTGRYGREEARKKMRKSIEEWVNLSTKMINIPFGMSFHGYIEEYTPFLKDQSSSPVLF